MGILEGKVAVVAGAARGIGRATRVSVEADADAMIDAATGRWRRLDCPVANAGVIPLSTVDQTSVEDWDHVMAVDGRGRFLTCRAALRVIAGQGSGTIVNRSSTSGIAGQVGHAAYGPGQHPQGRLGEPREMAQAIAFLASDRASFITGEVLAVDAGYLAP